MISVIVPLYNEGERVRRLVAHLQRIPGVGEAVLADASDAPASRAVMDALTEELARRQRRDNSNNRDSPDNPPAPIRVLRCGTPGRAAQMNAGAEQCSGSTLLFLHCDTRLPPDAAENIRRCIARGHAWGWFDLRLDARGPAYRVLERMINLRSRASRIATGDQAMFVERRAFARLRGFPGIALMEDVEMSRRLKGLGAPGVIPRPALTSARRWQKNGVLRTVLLMWKLRFLYWLGRSPEALAARYRDVR